MYALADRLGVPIQTILDMPVEHFHGHIAAAKILKRMAEKK